MVILGNIKEIKHLRGGDLVVAAQANVRIDAEIGKKDHFRMETTYPSCACISREIAVEDELTPRPLPDS